MAETEGRTVGATGAGEAHAYDVQTDSPLGLYTTVVRHQTGVGKVKEVRLQPSQTDLNDYFGAHADTSTVPHAVGSDASPENLPLYTSASGGESSQVQE